MLHSLLLPTLPLLFAAPQAGQTLDVTPTILETASAARGQSAENSNPATQDEGEPAQGDLYQRARQRLGKRDPKPQEFLRADGSPVLPGEVPKSASDTARTTWGALVDALATEQPMRSFELEFNLRQRSMETTQSNDLTLSFSYLAPRYVYASLESGRRLLRGKDGDFLIDGVEVIKLQGREAAADKKTLDEMAAIAATFMALTAPANLRLVDLAMLEQAPASIHPSFRAEMKEFLWMRVASPDFFLFTENKGKGIPVYQADIGIDPATKAIRFAVIAETAPGPNLPSSTIFVRMSDHIQRDGFLVPHRIEVSNLDPSATPPRFYRIATSRLDLKRKLGRLRAGLTVDDFVAPY